MNVGPITFERKITLGNAITAVFFVGSAIWAVAGTANRINQLEVQFGEYTKASEYRFESLADAARWADGQALDERERAALRVQLERESGLLRADLKALSTIEGEHHTATIARIDRVIELLRE